MPESSTCTGMRKWDRVLLTSAGFESVDGRKNEIIRSKFLELLGKPPEAVGVLFIPTAAVSDEAKYYAALCRSELADAGIREENIRDHDIDGTLTESEAMGYDVVYLPGGSTSHLLERVMSTGFDRIVREMVYANKVYVGVSAGSIIAAPRINLADAGNPDATTAGLSLVQAYISVHCKEGTEPRKDLPLPHIPLTDRQALWVTCMGYELIEG